MLRRRAAARRPSESQTLLRQTQDDENESLKSPFPRRLARPLGRRNSTRGRSMPRKQDGAVRTVTVECDVGGLMALDWEAEQRYIGHVLLRLSLNRDSDSQSPR